MTFIFKIAKIFMPSFLNFLFNIKIFGKENLPDEGPYIVASNHYSNWDPPILYYTLYPIIPYTMAKKELFKFFPINIILKSFYAFPIDRKNFKSSSLKLLDKLVQEKKVLLMFPEGTRTKNKDLSKIKIKPGTIYFALQYNLPVIPIHIKWPSTCSNTFIKRMSVEVYIKKPLIFDNFKNNLTKDENLNYFSELLLKEIRNIDS